MSEQEIIGVIPKSCNWKEKVWNRGAGASSAGSNKWIVGQQDAEQCLKDLKTSVDTQKSSEVQQGQVLIGGLSGAGGLACGLGLFPCLVKLVSKFKG